MLPILKLNARPIDCDSAPTPTYVNFNHVVVFYGVNSGTFKTELWLVSNTVPLEAEEPPEEIARLLTTSTAPVVLNLPYYDLVNNHEAHC